MAPAQNFVAGNIGSPSCVAEETQWVLTSEQVEKTAVRVQLRLTKSLRLCGKNETNPDCCPKPLCVLETLQVSACVNGTPQSSLLIQAKINALLVPTNAGYDNKTIIPNQVYQPLGSCPCDLTFRACDVRCCCDKDCSPEELKLFVSSCLHGPFGGQVSPAPDYQCTVQASENTPDWFPFLCVNSPLENNPYLGLFYEGDTIASKPGPSFQRPVLSAPVPVNAYVQGSPILTINDQYFTIPQVSCVQCGGLVCENVTLALDYKFSWKANDITNVTLTRTVGTITLDRNVVLTTSYSAVFLNGETMNEPNSGNPGYQVGKPVIAGKLLDTGLIKRTSINLWKPVSDGLCYTAEKKQILFGENSTSGCLLPVSQQNLTQCKFLRETVGSFQAALVTGTYVSKSGNPDPLTMTGWLNISFLTLNSSPVMEVTTDSCYGIPSHQHIHVWSLIKGIVQGEPQREIHALQVSYSLSTWAVECGGGDVSPCVDPMKTQLFPITSSVTFSDIPTNIGQLKTRYQINFTEYDCNRNDVCWPELVFPITKYYTGEPYSQSLAKGLILVFFFITASILGTPWRQIRQAWSSAAL
ncbi:Tectonic-2 Precursor [Channa argus]|uniref:Tectonic-2 n=1 Tax=Channa argus TaxID=215402 RepID=A0A6G1Q004_CHAAH|nr:Tectonic-2 Precursor [Channa argus]